MPYITVNDVRSALPQVPIGPTTKPSEGQVDHFTAETSQFVDAVLTGIGYQTPVVDEPALSIVREIVTAGVLAKTLQARDLGVRNPEEGGAPLQQRRFDRLVERLQDRDDPLHLKGAQVTRGAKPAAVFARSNAGTQDTMRDPDFTLDQEF